MNGAAVLAQLHALKPARRRGHVRKIASGHVEADGPLATLGDVCRIEAGADGLHVLAEVIAVHDERVVLTPYEQDASLTPGACVEALSSNNCVPVGDAFGARAIDALARPIDGDGPIFHETTAPLHGRVLTPLDRCDAGAVFETGVRAIDGLLTLARGQRIGIFAASGVGKTTLLNQLALQAGFDHCVACLVGERGGEVEAFWRTIRADHARARFTCVAATSDVSPALRVRAVHQALALAEHWRDRGRHVLFILDSATRFAMALRELGLAAGAPPTVRAYTPNVFAALPRLVERCGGAAHGGAITAVLTVLSETDDVDDPIAETMKSLLDGHIVLSRTLAEQGRFPAIDPCRSISRKSERLMAPGHALAARKALAQLSAHEDARVLIDSGVYRSGANPALDEALRDRDALLTFLRQNARERCGFDETAGRLQALYGGAGPHA